MIKKNKTKRNQKNNHKMTFKRCGGSIWHHLEFTNNWDDAEAINV